MTTSTEQAQSLVMYAQNLLDESAAKLEEAIANLHAAEADKTKVDALTRALLIIDSTTF